MFYVYNALLQTFFYISYDFVIFIISVVFFSGQVLLLVPMHSLVGVQDPFFVIILIVEELSED